MQGPGHFRCTQSIFDAGMESKTLPGQKQHELFFFFFTKLSDFLLCIKSCVIIQPLCHEFFIVAAFCLNAKWSTAAWPVCLSPSGLLYVCLVCLYVFKAHILFVMWLLYPVKARMHTSSNQRLLRLSRKQREEGGRARMCRGMTEKEE